MRRIYDRVDTAVSRDGWTCQIRAMTCAIRAEYDQVCDIHLSRLSRLGKRGIYGFSREWALQCIASEAFCYRG
jgi:hypothetical protein